MFRKGIVLFASISLLSRKETKISAWARMRSCESLAKPERESVSRDERKRGLSIDSIPV